MTIFQSNIQINKPVADVYHFLADMNNHQQLMPDNIENWTSDSNGASFDIPNMVKLSLEIEERVPNQEIRIIPAAKPPFDLELKWALSSNNKQTEVIFTISADLNIMMKMIASGPLQKLADTETANLANLLN
jgi:carbon monoxide dehydrogenase subunit G